MKDIKELIEDELTANYEKYYRLAFSYVKNEADALDVVQEGAYKAIKSNGKVRRPEYISTWVYRIMINEALAVLRKNKKNVPLDLDERKGQCDNYENTDLTNAIESLEETEQVVVKLRFLEDLTIKDISNICQINENTVKSRLYRALKKLKDYLEVDYEKIVGTD